MSQNLQAITLYKETLGQAVPYWTDVTPLLTGTINGITRGTANNYLVTSDGGQCVYLPLSGGAGTLRPPPALVFTIGASGAIFDNTNALRFLLVGNNVTAGANCIALGNNADARTVTWSVRVTPAIAFNCFADNAVGLAQPSTAFAYAICAGGGGGGPKIYRSLDNGSTWVASTVPAGASTTIVSIAAIGTTWVAAGDRDSYVSVDNGATFTISAATSAPRGGAGTITQRGLAVMGVPNGQYFLGNDAGGNLVRSFDGVNWLDCRDSRAAALGAVLFAGVFRASIAIGLFRSSASLTAFDPFMALGWSVDGGATWYFGLPFTQSVNTVATNDSRIQVLSPQRATYFQTLIGGNTSPTALGIQATPPTLDPLSLP